MDASETDNVPDLSLPEWSGVWSNPLDIRKLSPIPEEEDGRDTIAFIHNPKMKVPPELDGIPLHVLFNNPHITIPYNGRFVTIGYMKDKAAVLLWKRNANPMPYPLSLRQAFDGEQRLLKERRPMGG